MRIVCLAQRALGFGGSGVWLALAWFALQAHADPTLRHFDIQSQVASLALKEFARQADISLVFSSTVVANHQTAASHGDFTVIDGLQASCWTARGLSFKQVSANTIAINVTATTRDDPNPPAQPPAAEPQAGSTTSHTPRGTPT